MKKNGMAVNTLNSSVLDSLTAHIVVLDTQGIGSGLNL